MIETHAPPRGAYTPPARPTALVIGAGLGGLSAAIHLAVAGYAVTVLEKNERVGGKLDIYQQAGYTYDTGPSLFTMPWVVRDLFALAGRNADDYLDIVPVEPTCRYFWDDGTQFDAWQSLPRLLHEIERISPADVNGMLRFLAYASQIYDSVSEPFLYQPFAGFRSMFNPRLMRDGPRIDAFRTLDQAVQSFFTSPYLRQVFNRYATYNGSSPYLTPATFNVIAFIEFATGGWYIRGGMYRLAEALQQLAGDLGVDVQLNTPVQQLVQQQGRVTGAVTVAGQHHVADVVVANADPRYVYEQMLPTPQPWARRLVQQEPSCSGFVLLLGVARQYEQLAHHSIFFSRDYPGEFAALFAHGVPAANPTIYVCTSSITDAEHAPPGHMNMFVLVNAPALNGRVNWEREAPAYRDVVLRRLEQMGLHDLRQHITHEVIRTPADLATRYNASAGAIYGLASNNRFAAFLRPPQRARDVANLYFVGGGTHPGGGIPLALLSGRALASIIVKAR